MKGSRAIIAAAAIIAIAAIGIAVFALRARSTAAVPADETSVTNKVVKKKHLKKPGRMPTPDTKSTSALILGFPRTERNPCLLRKPPRLW